MWAAQRSDSCGAGAVGAEWVRGSRGTQASCQQLPIRKKGQQPWGPTYPPLSWWQDIIPTATHSYQALPLGLQHGDNAHKVSAAPSTIHAKKGTTPPHPDILLLCALSWVPAWRQCPQSRWARAPLSAGWPRQACCRQDGTCGVGGGSGEAGRAIRGAERAWRLRLRAAALRLQRAAPDAEPGPIAGRCVCAAYVAEPSRRSARRNTRSTVPLRESECSRPRFFIALRPAPSRLKCQGQAEKQRLPCRRAAG